jgi:hypothetical protein
LAFFQLEELVQAMKLTFLTGILSLVENTTSEREQQQKKL